MKYVTKTRFLPFVLLTVLLALVAGAAAAAGAATEGSSKITGLFGDLRFAKEQSDRARLAKLKTAIDAEIGKARARRLTQCKVIAFGAKPCGGPWKYLVYSRQQTNEPRLRQLVDTYYNLEKKYNKKNKIGSDCGFVEQPEVMLLDGICQIKRN